MILTLKGVIGVRSISNIMSFSSGGKVRKRVVPIVDSYLWFQGTA